MLMTLLLLLIDGDLNKNINAPVIAKATTLDNTIAVIAPEDKPLLFFLVLK